MQKNVASQRWIVFAFDTTDSTPKTGDAAQITAPAGGEIVDHDRMVASAHQVFNEM